jgi:hypothetical protein
VLARVVVVVLAVSAVAGAQPAEQAGAPIVLINTDAAFASALDDALVPAGMDVISIGDLPPPSSAELTARSRQLADAQRAGATVWLLPAPDGATIVTYDRVVDRLLVRELPYRSPLSATQAAEAARMVRTMLRALRVTDEPERPDVPALPPAPPQPMFGASVGASAWFQPPGATSTLAASFAVAWRPHGLGVALAATLAPAAAVTTSSFGGEVVDRVVAAELRNSLDLAPDLRLTPAAGLALHVVELEGAFAGSPLRSRRFDPAVRLGVTAAYALPHDFEVGLAVSADCLLRRQRYEAGTEEILVVPRLQIISGIIVGIRR